MIKHIETIQEYDTITSGEGLVLVDFFANWCGPCKMLTPVLEELDEKQAGKVKIIKVDVDDFMEVARRYNIQNIPTLLLFKDGKLVDTRMGYQNLNQLTAFINK